jgi:formylglycine-generating enzyme required for sulfatase activity
MRASGVSIVVGVLAFYLSPDGSATLAQERSIVAVFDLEVKGIELDGGTVDRLTDYLGSLLASKGYQVVPRSQIKDRLVAAKTDSYKDCYDQSCQIDIGKELAAQKSLASQVLKLGKKCKVTVNLFDLKKSASEGAGTASGECGEDEVVESLERAVGNLFGGMKAPAVTPVESHPGKLGYAEIAAQAAAEQKRKAAGLRQAWIEVRRVTTDQGTPRPARVLVLEKFLEDFAGINPHGPEARDMLARLKAGEEPLGMVRIPSGEFLMGCSPGDGECEFDEKPTHKVWVSEFFLDAIEVTVAAYRKCVQAGKCSAPNTGGSCTWGVAGKEAHPVNCVDWNQARSFCAWAEKRLPTEAEWEKAARGGKTGARYGNLNAIAWYDRKAGVTPQPVGKKQPNAFGLYDMLGNVWEWCADWHGDDYYQGSPERDPAGPGSGEYRVLRGGSWSSVEKNVRVSNRHRNQAANWDDHIGIRCAESGASGP